MTKRFSIFMIVMLMCLILFSTFAFADTSIKGCDVSDEICKSLQEKYGADSEVVYSMVETATCKYEFQVTDTNGNKRTVYVSALPTNTELAPPPVIDQGSGSIDNSDIVIKPGNTGINEISDHLLNSDNIVDNPTTDVDEIAIHNKLVELYGNNTNVYWNIVATYRCKYVTSIDINGVQVSVYLSVKPTTSDIGVSMGNNGKLEIDGVSSDDYNIVDYITYSIKKQSVGYPYNEINEKLIYIFGSDQDVRYFIEDDIESVKTTLSNKNKNYDEIVSDFHAINIYIKTGVKKVYVNKELTPDQEALLNTDINSETYGNNEPSETNSNTIQILLIISLIVNVALVCAFIFTIKKQKA